MAYHYNDNSSRPRPRPKKQTTTDDLDVDEDGCHPGLITSSSGNIIVDGIPVHIGSGNERRESNNIYISGHPSSEIIINGQRIVVAGGGGFPRADPQIIIEDRIPESESITSSVECDNDVTSVDGRLETFEDFPSGCPMSPAQLARAGFFYTGIADMVQCFICNGKVRDWEIGDSAFGEHLKFFPNCEFVHRQMDMQIQISVDREGDDESTMHTALPEDDLETDSFVDNYIGDIDGEFTLRPIQSYHHYDRNNSLLHLLKQHKYRPTGINANLNTTPKKEFNKRWGASTAEDESFTEQELDMTALSNRLSTYKSLDRGCTLDVSISQLAKEGIFYKDNLFSCSSCKYTIYANRYPNVSELHKMESPNCYYVKKYPRNPSISYQSEVVAPVGSSTPRDQELATSRSVFQSSVLNLDLERNICSPQSAKVMEKSFDLMSKVTVGQQMPVSARYMSYKTVEDDLSLLENRLRTFRNWPYQKPDKQSVARAGFVYKGVGGNVKCFYCDLVLLLNPNDDPFIEHARLLSSCRWFEEMKGDRFIIECKTRCYINQGETECGIRDYRTNGNSQHLPETTFEETPRDEKEQKTVSKISGSLSPSAYSKKLKLDANAKSKIKLAQEFGFNGDTIMAVVTKHLKDNNGVFSLSNEDMIEKVMDEDAANQEIKPSAHTEIPDLTTLTLNDTTTESLTSDTLKTSNEASQSKDDVAKELEDLKDQHACKICLDQSANILFRPCNHLVTCNECSKNINMCPVCRAAIEDRIKIYQS
ncbi:E3 ubiquitin-protein ligase XIAP-like [Antedon mediterranea]|uniref:E3 ubiquitin-protein ligase XIAP-like n=1 Tax=Antedon mediterranea TaxID=105859 RepID=UPI003AF58D9D